MPASTQPPTASLLFIGVGKMGLPMARHLHAAGHRVTAFDPSADRRALAAGAGLAVLETQSALQQALSQHPLVFSSLPDDKALLAVAAQVAEHGAVHAAGGAVWVDTSTVSPEASAQAAALCAPRGIQMLRSPVSGNNTMAERAALTVFASGPRAAYERVEPLLACWGPQRFYLGEGEQARFAKLAINLLIVGTSTMLAEALALGQRGGVQWGSLWQVIEASAAASPILRAKAPQLREHDYTPTFTVEQMRKDVALIRAAAQQLGVATPVTDVAGAALLAASAAGDGGEDYAVVIRAALQSAQAA
jgi:3-hydroxyisobutyrate dehydrogenase-like beta-hydroxyacid dehydrogenase